MNKEQVFELLKFIRNIYQNFEFDQDKLNAWHLLLKDQDSASVINKAQQYAKENRFPPAVSDLRSQRTGQHQTIYDIDIAFSKWISNGGDPEKFNYKTGKGIEH